MQRGTTSSIARLRSATRSQNELQKNCNSTCIVAPMLIEFRVENFRSFHKEQSLSFTAAPRLKRKENTLQLKLPSDPVPPLLKAIAIYGPNASGKSNLIKALEVVSGFAHGHYKNRSSLPIAPFRFSELAIHQPSKFELHFVHGGVRFEFGLWVSARRIMREWLTCYPNGHASPLYDRQYSSESEKDEYTFGEALEGGSDLHRLWSNATTHDTLFLSRAVENSSDEFKQLRSVQEWFRSTLTVVDEPQARWLMWAANQTMQEHEDVREAVAAFLSEVDIPISSIKVDKRPGSMDFFKTPPSDPGALRRAVVELTGIGQSQWQTTFTHLIRGKKFDFDFNDESDGTKSLYAFAPLWLSCAAIPQMLAIDEIDTSLHPAIVTKLVRTFLEQNTSQVVFTTHDTHLMDSKLLRRDQYWIVERDQNGASILSSVYDYEGREGEDIEKRYFAGRYRGLPIVKG